MRPLKNLAEVAVIGGGMAGLSAARHAARLGRLVTLFEETGLYGGQLATVGHIDGLLVPGNYSGQDLAIPLLEDVRKAQVRVVEAGVRRIDLDERVTLVDETGGVHHPEAVILASGASLRRLGVPGEEEYHGRGVSRCASCDGGFFRKQEVAVVGGGDAAAHEALVLAGLCGRVRMICRGPLRAKRDYIDRLAALENVTFHWDSEVVEILGDAGGVTAVRLRDVRSGALTEIACAGIFPFIGVEPNSGCVSARLTVSGGHVATGADFASADPRLFAAGAVRAGYGGNILQAMAEGIGAAESAHRMLVGRTARRQAETKYEAREGALHGAA